MSDESARLEVVRRYWEYPGADVDRAHEIYTTMRWSSS